MQPLIEERADEQVGRNRSETAAAAEIRARERARFASKGIRWPTVDGQIAAIAVANNAALVTRNAADFRRFPGLRLADWFGK